MYGNDILCNVHSCVCVCVSVCACTCECTVLRLGSIAIRMILSIVWWGARGHKIQLDSYIKYLFPQHLLRSGVEHLPTVSLSMNIVCKVHAPESSKYNFPVCVGPVAQCTRAIEEAHKCEGNVACDCRFWLSSWAGCIIIIHISSKLWFPFVKKKLWFLLRCFLSNFKQHFCKTNRKTSFARQCYRAAKLANVISHVVQNSLSVYVVPSLFGAYCLHYGKKKSIFGQYLPWKIDVRVNYPEYLKNKSIFKESSASGFCVCAAPTVCLCVCGLMSGWRPTVGGSAVWTLVHRRTKLRAKL